MNTEVAFCECRRGYAAERQEGLLFGAKLDYLQSLLLRKTFNWLSKPLFNGGTWINQVFPACIHFFSIESFEDTIDR
jgi:hypothetical protein